MKVHELGGFSLFPFTIDNGEVVVWEIILESMPEPLDCEPGSAPLCDSYQVKCPACLSICKIINIKGVHRGL